MKKLYSLLFCISMFSGLFAGTIQKEYTFSSPEVAVNDAYQTINFEGCMLTSPIGEPVMPYFPVKLLLPPGEIATNIEFIGEDEIVMDGNYQLYPSQPSRPISKGVDGRFYKNDDIYSSDKSYPVKQIGGLSTSYLNGYGFALSSFTPIKYKPSTGKISYFTKVKIIITTTSAKSADEALMNLSSRKTVIDRVRNFAQNPTNINFYTNKSKLSDNPYELLILTTAQYENDFEDLRDIYLSRGIRSKIFTKEYIVQNISGQDVPEKIRNFIIQEYQESDIEYVLLGGDVENIPYRGFYCYVESGSGYTDYGIPADLYYSALDGNWNDNGDSKWGEPDEDDLLPEVAVARFPFSNIDELNNLKHKSISYQNSPVVGEFQKPFLAGENLYSGPDTWGKDYLDLLIGEHSDNGYTTSGFPETYNYETMYEFDASWSGSDLINKINEGKQFVHHVGHANTTYVAHLSNGDITDANFYGANGVDHNYTIMQTHGCDCGGFDANDCILERMVNIQNFAVAVIGNSRYGWFNEGQTEGPSQHLHREMVDAMFNDQIAQIGKAFVESKIQTAPWVEAPGQWEEGALRWNFYDINVLGDPAMSVWNDEPIEIDVDYPEQVSLGTTSFEVTLSQDASPLENYSCAIMMDGELLSAALSNDNGVSTLNFNPAIDQPGEASLIVSGYNCLPDTNQIMFIAAGEPYVIYSENQIDDENGNQNGMIDCGENIMLNLAMENIGELDALDVNSVLSTENEYVSFVDDTEPYGDVEMGETVMKNQAFSFDVANNIPDQTELNFVLTASDNNSDWTSEFSLMANAPVLSSSEITVNDEVGGNANGIIDPGETIIIDIVVSNIGHSKCFDASSVIESNSVYLDFDNTTVEMGDLGISDSFVCEFTVNVDASAPQGTQLNLILNMLCGEYEFQAYYVQTVGLLIEDFESGDFSSFDWVIGGVSPWIVTDEDVFEGDFSGKSGDITDGEESNLMIQIEVNGDDEISFFRKVSSEPDWDFLEFYIDGVMKGSWSGEESWEEFTYSLTSGTHILKWSYVKDSYMSGGADCAWLDNIIFPATATILDVYESESTREINIYPNPSTGLISISSNVGFLDSDIKVYDINGRMVYENKLNSKSLKSIIDLSNVRNGLYFIEFKNSQSIIVEKLVIKK